MSNEIFNDEIFATNFVTMFTVVTMFTKNNLLFLAEFFFITLQIDQILIFSDSMSNQTHHYEILFCVNFV